MNFNVLIGRFAKSRIFFTFLSAALLTLTYTALKVTWFSDHFNDSHFEEAVELWYGLGVVILGFGVLLEEFQSLKKIIYPKHVTNQRLENACHKFGVLLVVAGVFIEVIAWLIKIPNEVLDTKAVESFLLQIAAVSGLLVIFLVFNFIYSIWFGKD
jgi:hypothetical protein